MQKNVDVAAPRPIHVSAPATKFSQAHTIKQAVVRTQELPVAAEPGFHLANTASDAQAMDLELGDLGGQRVERV